MHVLLNVRCVSPLFLHRPMRSSDVHAHTLTMHTSDVILTSGVILTAGYEEVHALSFFTATKSNSPVSHSLWTLFDAPCPTTDDP